MNKKGKIVLAGIVFLMLAVLIGVFISLSSDNKNGDTVPGTNVAGQASGEETENTDNTGNTENTVTEILTEAEEVDSYEWDEAAKTTFINLGDGEGKAVTVDGSGVTLSGNDIIIEDSGQYEVTGTLADGRIVIDAQNETVYLRLNNADINCSYSSAIYGYKADKLTIVLKEGTENSLKDSADYSFDDAYSAEAEEEPNACIYAKTDLLICGTGSLAVTGSKEQGITCNDILEIADAGIEVTGVGKAILGKDKLVVSNAEITADAGDDAIHSNGNVLLDGGTYTLAAGDDGIHADAGVVVSKVQIQITESNEGIEGWQVYLLDSEISITSEDDAVNAANGLTDGTDFGGFGGKEFGNGEFGGREFGNGEFDGREFGGGEFDGGEFGSGEFDGGEFGGKEFGDKFGGDASADGDGVDDAEILLTIKNTKLYINAGGDGIDSNGSVYMDGGFVVVYGPDNSGNGGLDYENKFELVSGTLLVMDMSGMAMQPDICSIPGIDVTLSQNLAAGDVICVSSDSYSYCFEAVKGCNHFTLITPDMSEGDEVTVLTGGSCTEALTEALVKDAAYSGGSEAASLTLENGITSYGGMGGMHGGFSR